MGITTNWNEHPYFVTGHISPFILVDSIYGRNHSDNNHNINYSFIIHVDTSPVLILMYLRSFSLFSVYLRWWQCVENISVIIEYLLCFFYLLSHCDGMNRNLHWKSLENYRYSINSHSIWATATSLHTTTQYPREKENPMSGFRKTLTRNQNLNLEIDFSVTL